MAIKQVTVIRRDLHMRRGKEIAQAQHASMKVFFDRMKRILAPTDPPCQVYQTEFTPAMLSWLDWEEGEPGFTKIVVSCNSEEELFNIEAKAREAGIVHALIKDNGVTEFHGVQTPTCICLGPDEAEKIDPITGGYSLL